MLKPARPSDDARGGRLAVLRVLTKLHQPSMQDLIDATGLSRATVQRQLKELRDLYKMDIRYYRKGWARGAVGFYQVDGWGLFSPEKLKAET